MKRILLLLISIFTFAAAFSQNAEYLKSIAKYKDVPSLTAAATRIIYKNGKSSTSNGMLYVKHPGRVLIQNGKDALLMNGATFTMKKGPLKARTNSMKDLRYKTFHDVLESIFTGGETDLSKNKDVKIRRSGTNVVLTITPEAGEKKLMFSSFILTVDSRAQELRSIRMTQKGSNYTEYKFSNYKLKAAVDDKVFK